MATLQAATRNFLNHCKFEKNLSPKTLKAYEIDLKQLQTFLVDKGHGLMVVEITRADLRDYLEHMAPLKPKTIRRKIATLKAMFNYLEFDDVILLNPFRKMRISIREPKRLPNVLNMAEIRSLFKSAYSKTTTLDDSDTYAYFETVRNIVVLELLFATGGRVSEIANLRDEQVDISSGLIIIRGKGNKERIIQICNPETITILKRYRRLFRDKILSAGSYFLVNRFNSKLSDQSIRGIVKKLCQMASIKKSVTPHVFRHTFATLLLEKDVDIKYIQSMLGHSSIMTTQIYTHVNKHKQKQILRTKHPRKDFSTASFTAPD